MTAAHLLRSHDTCHTQVPLDDTHSHTHTRTTIRAVADIHQSAAADVHTQCNWFARSTEASECQGEYSFILFISQLQLLLLLLHNGCQRVSSLCCRPQVSGPSPQSVGICYPFSLCRNKHKHTKIREITLPHSARQWPTNWGWLSLCLSLWLWLWRPTTVRAEA